MVPRLLVAGLAVCCLGASAAEPERAERSYWLHASLASLPQRGYWGPEFPVCAAPTKEEIGLAAGLLGGHYGANRLYLVCHAEMSLAETLDVLLAWRSACPPAVELVPTLVLRMYDEPRTPVYTAADLARLATFGRDTLRATHLGVYDVLPDRDQHPELAALDAAWGQCLVRVGLQPGEKLDTPFTSAVQDTWSGFCHGRRNEEDWRQPGFGADVLRDWVAARNAGTLPIAWDLITVAWDYKTTERGAYPGYDDAERNDPLPADRNRLAAALIRATAAPDRLAGFSSDLCILQANSRAKAHDGPAGAFYETLRAGRVYQGAYAAPLAEVAAIYRGLAAGAWPK